MTKLLAFAIGAIFGGMIGCLKYFIQWHNALKGGRILSKGALYLRLILNFVWDIGALSLLYVMRYRLPFGLAAYWNWVLIGAALTLALVIQLIPLKTVFGNKNGEE